MENYNYNFFAFIDFVILGTNIIFALNMELTSLIDDLPSTSPVTIKKLKSLQINTVWNLINYFPFRYEDYSLQSTINEIQIGEIVTIKGRIIKTINIVSKTGLRIQKVTVSDDTGKIDVIWYNQPFLVRILRQGLFISLAASAKGFFHNINLEAKEYEIIESLKSETIHTARLVPIYPEKKGLSSRLLREKIFYIINRLFSQKHAYFIKEILPQEIVAYNKLISEDVAYKEIHFPKNLEHAKSARERLAFDELFTIQLSAQLIRRNWDKENVGNPFKVETRLIASLQEFINNLPFKLTSAQNQVVSEIISDLKKTRPMNRFLEGDVGSGKTVVAAIACYLAYLNGFQSLLMAPTEILAFQHHQTISNLFKKYPLKIALQTQSKKHIEISPRSRKNVNFKKAANYDIIIGTHALLNEKISFDRIGLVVIDEQHRFGVAQRAKLKEKGVNPHLLTMTATPIPRTVALTLYGELDLSVIDEMPKGRLVVKTFLVPGEKRESGYLWIKNKIKNENVQIFIICPLIEESDVETMKSVKAVTKEYEKLKTKIFPEFKLEFLHGKIKSQEKNRIMKEFKTGRFDILVSTPVVEVGIDIPNATIMLIEAAERFGLAQLHQLRGRVGRGDKQSYCLLFTESETVEVRDRLQFFTKTDSGMKVAEYDLKMRGPGEVYGSRQHGYLNLKIASLSDYNLIEKSKKAANYFINKYQIKKYPGIKRRLEEYKVRQISRD